MMSVFRHGYLNDISISYRHAIDMPVLPGHRLKTYLCLHFFKVTDKALS
jgi:hypothetical protein